MFEIVCDRELAKHNIRREDVIIPTRKTKYSAGYDFHSPLDYTLNIIDPNKFKVDLVPTGIKCKIPKKMYLQISLRSGFSIKNSVFQPNASGVVDADYYNNPDNDGHIFIPLFNYGAYGVAIEKGKGIAQGIFLTYVVLKNEDKVETIREGGFGSTSK